MLGSGWLAQQIFNQQPDAERSRKGAQMFESGLSIFDGARRPGIRCVSQVNDQVAEGELIGGLQGALDLVHGVDAAGFFRVQKVDTRAARAAHITIGIERGMH